MVNSEAIKIKLDEEQIWLITNKYTNEMRL